MVDAADPAALARFWAEATGWPPAAPSGTAVSLRSAAGTGPFLEFLVVGEPKRVKNRVHLDVAPRPGDDHAAEVARLRALGATPADVGQGDVPWVVLADPEGNELCVLDPREEYAATGAVAAIVVDAADPAGQARFWAEAAGWPPAAPSGTAVSLRAASGTGPFLEFLAVDEPKRAKNRVHLDVAPHPDDDHAAEVARLRALGATPADVGQGDVTWVVLADPEGNELCVLTPR